MSRAYTLLRKTEAEALLSILLHCVYIFSISARSSATLMVLKWSEIPGARSMFPYRAHCHCHYSPEIERVCLLLSSACPPLTSPGNTDTRSEAIPPHVQLSQEYHATYSWRPQRDYGSRVSRIEHRTGRIG